MILTKKSMMHVMDKRNMNGYDSKLLASTM